MKRKLPTEKVVELYQSGMSAMEIEQKFGVGRETTYRDLEKVGVPKRGLEEARKLAWERGTMKPPPSRKGYRQSAEHIEKRIKRGDECYNWKGGYSPHHYRSCKERDVCLHCGSTTRLAIHHIDENRCNNSPGNLVVLCNSCHSKHHSRKRYRGTGLQLQEAP